MFRCVLRPASRSSTRGASRDALKPVLENPAIEKIGQNLKYDQIVLRTAGIELAGAAFDTMVADYLLDPGERSHNMDDLARGTSATRRSRSTSSSAAARTRSGWTKCRCR